MIVRLRSHRKYQWRGYYYGKHIVGDMYTDKQIMQALGIDRKKLNACLKAYELVLPGRRWNAVKVKNEFTKFVNLNGRWPTSTDMKNWRENGLPANQRTFDIWYGYNRLVEEWCRAHKRQCTPQLIFSIRNLTTRRNMITFIGIDNLIKGGKCIQQDDFGKLWKLPTDSRDPHMLYVEVVNKSPQLDAKGKVVKNRHGDPVFDHYFLRVPHWTRSAKDAVAWTLNIPETEFAGFQAES